MAFLVLNQIRLLIIYPHQGNQLALRNLGTLISYGIELQRVILIDFLALLCVPVKQEDIAEIPARPASHYHNFCGADRANCRTGAGRETSKVVRGDELPS